jgi:hypothetical protein
MTAIRQLRRFAVATHHRWYNGGTMSLNIKNEEAHALAVRVAKATGESLTEAVTSR